MISFTVQQLGGFFISILCIIGIYCTFRLERKQFLEKISSKEPKKIDIEDPLIEEFEELAKQVKKDKVKIYKKRLSPPKVKRYFKHKLLPVIEEVPKEPAFELPIKNGVLTIDEDFKKIHSVVSVKVNGNVSVIDAGGSVTINGNCSGRIDSGGSTTISGSSVGNIDAGGSVKISGQSHGNIDAGGSVRIGKK